MRTAIIFGSSRDHGNTRQLVDHLARRMESTTFNLAHYDISHYDYEHQNRNDDFLPLMQKILNFDRFILASPVYWYAPSGIMKIFIDRLSDLITIEKELGRRLRHQHAALLASGCDLLAPACFEEMFYRTFQHLGLHYQGMLYCSCTDEIDFSQHLLAIDDFIQALHA